MSEEVIIPAIEKAIELIENAFEWEKTPQGFEYWESVIENLYQVIDEYGEEEKV